MDLESSRHKQPKSDIPVWLLVILGGILVLVIVVVGLLILQNLNPQKTAQTNNMPTESSLTATEPVEKPVQNYVASIENTSCPFTPPDQAQVACGFLIVPEDRSGDVTDTIRVAYAVFHSTDTNPQPDPILYLQGGPGAEAISWSLDVYDEVVAPLLAERDFVVFDPRGVGHSEPSLECAEFKTTYLQDIQGKVPETQKASYYEGALLGCKNRLLQAGVNLSAYTSADIAADAKDLIVALGYPRANLYGISYGTRIGQLLMRDHPEVVRSAVLDSVVPIEAQLLDPTTTDWEAALRVLFDQCQKDAACSSAYPELEKTYNEVVQQLDSQPITVSFPIDQNRTIDQVVDGSTFRDTVLWSLRTPQTITVTPRLIYKTRDQDYSILKFALAYPLFSFDTISAGLYISVNCHDQVFAMSTEKLDETIFEMCKLWNTRPLTAGENSPVNSDIPSLILAGTFDPVTPPSFASQLASHLTHAYLVETIDQGHAPSATDVSGCSTKIILTFLQSPDVSPDQTCVNEAQAMKFIVPYTSNSPLNILPATVDMYQVSTGIPEGWTPADFGFFSRLGWAGDQTQIGIQRAAVPENDWITWLMTNFRGNQGLAQPAGVPEHIQASGLSWSIYKTSSQGSIIDLAFAKSGNETLMILMVSYPDEHEALYQAAFVPALTSTRSTK